MGMSKIKNEPAKLQKASNIYITVVNMAVRSGYLSPRIISTFETQLRNY